MCVWNSQYRKTVNNPPLPSRFTTVTNGKCPLAHFGGVEGHGNNKDAARLLESMKRWGVVDTGRRFGKKTCLTFDRVGSLKKTLYITPWKINTEPKNQPTEKDTHLPNIHCWVPAVDLPVCTAPIIMLCINTPWTLVLLVCPILSPTYIVGPYGFSDADPRMWSSPPGWHRESQKLTQLDDMSSFWGPLAVQLSHYWSWKPWCPSTGSSRTTPCSTWHGKNRRKNLTPEIW